MSRIDALAEAWGRHIAAPPRRALSGAERVAMIVYDKERERALRARKAAFETAAARAGYAWREVDLAPAFAEWMAADEYRDAHFAAPETLKPKLEARFPCYAARRLRAALAAESGDAPGGGPGEKTVVAAFGAGALFGFARLSHVLGMVEGDIRGRLAVFFPGRHERGNYRLLDARDGWNYLAAPIAAGAGESA